MRENYLRRLWQEGGTAVNCWLTIDSSVSAEALAQLDWNSMTVDLQHGLVDWDAAVPILQTISATDAVPMMRVPWNNPAWIMRALDAGAYGVICPMVNSSATCSTSQLTTGCLEGTLQLSAFSRAALWVLKSP